MFQRETSYDTALINRYGKAYNRLRIRGSTYFATQPLYYLSMLIFLDEDQTK